MWLPEAAKAPDIPEIRYNSIIALERAGRRDEARKELDLLRKTGKDTPEPDWIRA
jgi:hypothetical protein